MTKSFLLLCWQTKKRSRQKNTFYGTCVWSLCNFTSVILWSSHSSLSIEPSHYTTFWKKNKKKQKSWFICSWLCVCVCPCVVSSSPSQSSDFSGRLKLLYYSPRVCQIPRHRQTHHPSPALCLRGNRVSAFPGWQICEIVLPPGSG